MSYARSPREVCSTTIGTSIELFIPSLLVKIKLREDKPGPRQMWPGPTGTLMIRLGGGRILFGCPASPDRSASTPTAESWVRLAAEEVFGRCVTGGPLRGKGIFIRKECAAFRGALAAEAFTMAISKQFLFQTHLPRAI